MKKPSYTALLKEVRKLRKATTQAQVVVTDHIIGDIELGALDVARVETAKRLGHQWIVLRRNYSYNDASQYRIHALQVEDVNDE